MVNKHTFTLAVLLTALAIMVGYMRLDDRIAQLEHIVYQRQTQVSP